MHPRAVPVALGGLTAGWSLFASAYVGALVAAAHRRRGERAGTSCAPDAAPAPRVVVLVPAHDEAAGIGAAVDALVGGDYPVGSREVIVIADNCTDATTHVAREHEATVWERVDPSARGKGQALAWALDRLPAMRPETEIVAMVDADCIASRSLLRELVRVLGHGADAAQARYTVGNPDASPAAALRYAGYALTNVVRPLGKERAGLSCGLFGSGMAFPRRTLEQVPWDAFSITEDREYHLRLVDAGLRARFVESAEVVSDVPTTFAAGETQQMRWEAGNLRLVRRWFPRLVRRGGRDRLHAAIELLVPPNSLVVLCDAVAWSGGVGGRSATVRRAASIAATLQALSVLAALRRAGAPRSAYGALLHAPWLVARKLSQYGRIASGRGPRSWVRTARA